MIIGVSRKRNWLQIMSIKEVKIKVDNRNLRIILIFIIHLNKSDELYYLLSKYFILMSNNINQNGHSTNMFIPNGTSNSQTFDITNNTNMNNKLESQNQPS